MLLQQAHIFLGPLGVALSRVEQEQVVVHIGHTLIIGIFRGEPVELFLTEPQVVELVLEDDARVVESFLDHIVAGGFLFFGEGYLRQVVFAVMRVVLQTVLLASHRVGRFLFVRGGVVGQLVFTAVFADASHHRLVHALPVVGVLALAPLFLEGLLALVHSHLVVEVPQSVLLVGHLRGVRPLRGVVAAAHGAVLCHHLFGLGFLLRLFLLFLLLLQRLYHPVYGCVAVGLAHGGEGQQRVLQVDGVGIGHQTVENL